MKASNVDSSLRSWVVNIRRKIDWHLKWVAAGQRERLWSLGRWQSASNRFPISPLLIFTALFNPLPLHMGWIVIHFCLTEYSKSEGMSCVRLAYKRLVFVSHSFSGFSPFARPDEASCHVELLHGEAHRARNWGCPPANSQPGTKALRATAHEEQILPWLSLDVDSSLANTVSLWETPEQRAQLNHVLMPDLETSVRKKCCFSH